jgi:hypothetical protein
MVKVAKPSCKISKHIFTIYLCRVLLFSYSWSLQLSWSIQTDASLYAIWLRCSGTGYKRDYLHHDISNKWKSNIAVFKSVYYHQMILIVTRILLRILCKHSTFLLSRETSINSVFCVHFALRNSPTLQFRTSIRCHFTSLNSLTSILRRKSGIKFGR